MNTTTPAATAAEPAGWDRHAGRRPPVSLGDLIRVAGVLRPAPEVLARAARLLWPPAEPGPAAPTAPAPAPLVPVTALAGPPPAPEVDRERLGDRVRPAGNDPRPPHPDVRVERLTVASGPPRRARLPVHELLPQPPGRPGPTAPSLFRTDYQRAIVAELARAARPGPDIDVGHLIELLATRRPIQDVPRATARTTRAGLHLLLDMGPSMRPFLRDLRLLVLASRSVIGQDAVTALRFAGRPTVVRDVDGGMTDRAYEPPVTPCAVLVATDLGTAAAATGTSPARPEDWAAFVRTVHGAGCPLVLLVPCPPERWPAWADRRLAIVTWDLVTAVGQARRAAKQAAGLARSPL
ncbi:hypothetical protein AB0B78_10985 [Streptomyces sp. NPDC040724]|uniref:hypothetical protein n=1 Tax=Streptomyces sp. NPDC040724 TaxID=3155612 RepID=UPI0033E5B5CF